MKLKPADPKQPKKLQCGQNNECVRCGYCCYDFWCVIGSLLHTDKDGPCPELLKDDDGIHYCNALLRFDERLTAKFKRILDVGGGCGSLSTEGLQAIINGSFFIPTKGQL